MDRASVKYPTSNNNRPKVGSRSFWMAFCLTFPVLAKIILPSSLETLLEMQFIGVPVFLPNLLCLLFLLYSEKNHADKELKTIFWFQFLFMLLGFFFNGKSSLAFLLAGNFYYYILFLGLYCRIGLSERYWINRFMTIALLILGAEVFLLGLGIVKGFGAVVVAEDAQEFGDFFRVSTTAGAATGTAVHLYLLTAICVMLSESVKWRYFIFAYGLSATVLTVSRGGAAAFLLYFMLWLFFKVKDGRGSRLKIIVGAVAVVALLYGAGVFNPILERVELKGQDGTMLESREDRASTALSYYNQAESKLLGLGMTSLFRSSEIRHMGYENVVAPHNSYIQTLCEQGIIGLCLMILFWLVFIIRNRRSRPVIITMLPILLVLWNTESVPVVLSDYLISLSIIVMLALDKKRYEYLQTV